MSVTELPGRESPDAGQGGRPSRRPTEDDVFDVLANRRRRYVLRALASDPAGRFDIGELAERVAAWENDRPIEQISGAERKRVYTALQQSHLPKMEDAGVVTYDKDAGTVDATPAIDRFEVHLGDGDDRPFRWSRLYLALAAAGATALAAASTGLLPGPLSSEARWAALVVASVAVTALVHELTARGVIGDGSRGEGESEREDGGST